MLNRPPLYPSNLTPEDIIHARRSDFIKHYKLSLRCYSFEEFERTFRSWDQETREIIASIYEELRRFGFYPVGITSKNEIRWHTVTDSRKDAVKFQGIDKKTFSKEEITLYKRKFNQLANGNQTLHEIF